MARHVHSCTREGEWTVSIFVLHVANQKGDTVTTSLCPHGPIASLGGTEALHEPTGIAYHFPKLFELLL